MSSWRLGSLAGVLIAVLGGSSCGRVTVDESRAGPDGAGGSGSGSSVGTGGTSGTGGLADGGGEDAATQEDMPEGPRSGSRLEVRGFQADGVSTASGVIFDTERGVTCAPAGSADGGQRCLPEVPPEVRVLFADAECTVPIIGWVAQEGPCGEGAQTPRYALEYRRSRCAKEDVQVYEVGPEVAAPGVVYGGSDVGCEVVPGAARYSEAVPSPARDWVSFEREVTPVTSRLGVVYWNGEDGSRVFGGASLLPEDILCDEETFAEGSADEAVTRCFPTRRASVGAAYDSETCEEPVSLTYLCEPPVVVHGVVVVEPTGPDGCFVARVPRYYEAERVESTSVHLAVGPDCVPTEFQGFDYHRRGRPVPIDEFPVIESVHEGSGRLQPVYATSEGKKLFARPGVFFDVETASECELRELVGDGRTFCVPPLGVLSTFDVAYLDARCEDMVLTADACTGAKPLATFTGIEGDGVCPGAEIVRLVPREPSVPRVYSKDPGSRACEPSDRGSRIDVYDLGERVDPKELFVLFGAAPL